MRLVKRVPMDFSYPLNTVWYPYRYSEIEFCCTTSDRDCEACKLSAKAKGMQLDEHGCPVHDEYFSEVVNKLKELCEPPKGDGYQLWEDVTEGSPISPVFATLEELCEWCEANATVFGDATLTRQEWIEYLS